MNKEEYERLKNEEKEHLRQLRELKQRYREAKRVGSIQQALQNMDPRKVLDTHDQMLEQLAMDTLRDEAKYEVAMEAREEQQKAEEQAAERARYEEEQRKNDAADLVRRFKAELAGGTPQASASASTPAPKSAAEPKPQTPQPDPLPEKTIGRIKHQPPNVYPLKRRDEEG